jgi:hypothetical protein
MPRACPVEFSRLLLLSTLQSNRRGSLEGWQSKMFLRLRQFLNSSQREAPRGKPVASMISCVVASSSKRENSTGQARGI